MSEIIYPFKIYDGFKGQYLIGFANLQGKIVYEISYEEAMRLDDRGYFYGVKKDEKWYKLSSEKIEILDEIPNPNSSKKTVLGLALKSKELLQDSTEDFYIIKNGFDEELVYDKENKLIFDPWTHYKTYIIEKYSKPTLIAEDYIKRLDKLKRNQMLEFLKTIETKDYSFLYNYAKESQTKLGKRIHKKFVNCLSYRAWEFVEDDCRDYKYFWKKHFNEEYIKAWESPLEIAEKIKTKRFGRFFIKNEKYVKKINWEVKTNNIYILYNLKDKTVFEYEKFSDYLFSIAKEQGLLAIDSIQEIEKFPILKNVIDIILIKSMDSNSALFKLYFEQLKEKELLKNKNYYRVIELFTLMIMDFTSRPVIANIFEAFGAEKREDFFWIWSEEELNDYTKQILNRNFEVNENNFENLLEFLKYIALVEDFLRNRYTTIFQSKKSELVKIILEKIEKSYFPEELKKWCKIILLEKEKAEEILIKLQKMREKDMKEIDMKFEIVLNFMHRLEKNRS